MENNTLKQYMKETYRYGFLSEAKELQLAGLIKKGDMAAREELINAHLKMVFTIAKRFNKSYAIPLEDLIQEGNLGLVTAADNFNATKKIRFASYAKWWVSEFIKRKFYKELYIVSTPVRVVKKSFEMSRDGNLKKQEVKQGENKAIQNILQRPKYLSDVISRNKYESGGELSLSSVLKDERESAEEMIEKKDFRQYLVKRVRYYLNKEESHIIKRRYLSGDVKLTYKNLGSELEVSSETVRNIEKRALAKLVKKMKNELNVF